MTNQEWIAGLEAEAIFWREKYRHEAMQGWRRRGIYRDEAVIKADKDVETLEQVFLQSRTPAKETP